MDNKKTISDYQRSQQEIKARLEALGVKLEDIQELAALVTEHDEMEQNLDVLRAQQFADDAHAFLVSAQIATQKNEAKLSAFLREFAEHVVSSLDIFSADEITERVDQIKASHDRFE